MRILISVLLTAALIGLVDSPAQLNNSAQPTQKIASTVEPVNQRTRATDLSTKQPQGIQAEAVKTETEPKPEPVAATPTPVKAEEPMPQTLSEHEQVMQDAGIEQSDWSSVDYIISHESSWRPTIQNNEGCIGLGQRCPASTLLSACPDLNATCQLRHFTQYAVTRYGGWKNAAAVWQAQRWW